jgi:hypothetical protein
LEERDLMATHGEYAAYRRRVPMIIPRFVKKSDPKAETSEETAV